MKASTGETRYVAGIIILPVVRKKQGMKRNPGIRRGNGPFKRQVKGIVNAVQKISPFSIHSTHCRSHATLYATRQS